MPSYSYRCQECEAVFDATVSRAECAQPQPCSCGGDAKRVVGTIGFVLKGDGWVGKNQKIKGQMARKNVRLDTKSRERRHDAPGVRLVPNVEGERVDSWDEAAKLAKSKGYDNTSFKQMAQQEKADR